MSLYRKHTQALYKLILYCIDNKTMTVVYLYVYKDCCVFARAAENLTLDLFGVC